jgi:DNA polymerase-3 subunit epsilon
MAPPFPEVWGELQRFVGGEVLVAHNARFDQTILDDCLRYHGLEPSEHTFACSLRLARRAWSARPVRLPDVCARLGFPLRHHDPESDAEGAARIALAAAARLGIEHAAELARPPRRRRPRRTRMG